MKIPTSSATMANSRGSTWPGERSGASACTATIVPTPSSNAAAARKARLRRSSVRSEAVGGRGNGRAHDTTCGGERGAQVGGVLHRVGEIRLFGGHEVPEIRLHRSQIRLLLRVGELRNRDGGQNTDDHHHDQKLDQGKALAVHSTTSPTRKIQDAK